MNQYVYAGGVLLAVGIILGLIGVIWWFAGRKRPAHIPGPVMKYLERINWAALLIFFGYGTVWYLGNIEYGNQVALVLILDAAEVANGTDTLQPWVRSWFFAFIVNFLPSSGQWWRWALKPKGKNLYTSFVISGIDWALNIVGLYTGYAPFRSPLNFFVLLVVAVVTYIPNFWCQDVAQDAGRTVVRTWSSVRAKQKKLLTSPSPTPSPHSSPHSSP